MYDSLLAECRWIWNRCRARLRAALALSLAFKALNWILLAPLAAGVLRLGLALWGQAAVGNFELARFFLSPVGLTATLTVGAVLLASLYVELAGLLRILALPQLHWWEAFTRSTRLFPRLLRLGMTQLMLYLAPAVPFLAGIALAYWWLWSGRDLNGLIILRPPAFWWGAGWAGLCAAIYLLLAGRMFLRQVLAVPILLLEPGTGVHAALHTSRQRTRGRRWGIAAWLAAWFGGQLLLAAAVWTPLGLAARTLLASGGDSVPRLIVSMGAITVVETVVITLLGVVGNISFVGVVLVLYRRTLPADTAPLAELRSPAADTPPAADAPRGRALGGRLAGGLALGCVAVLLVSGSLLLGLELPDDLEITAHRAGALGGPENTVAALKQAIADRADWAEIDVQLTADQALVVLHDIDLARVGGGSRRVDQATLEQIRALDVGAPFGPQFAGERIPTFDEMLAAAGSAIRLNVELKPHSRADGAELARRVVAAIQQAEMVPRCRLCSQSLESLQVARQLEPRLEIGHIVATAVGDPTRLAVDFLMVKSNLAVPAFVARARLAGLEVHAWTVNDAALVAPLLDAGVANIITDDPAAIRARLKEIRELDLPERLLLRAAHTLKGPGK